MVSPVLSRAGSMMPAAPGNTEAQLKSYVGLMVLGDNMIWDVTINVGSEKVGAVFLCCFQVCQHWSECVQTMDHFRHLCFLKLEPLTNTLIPQGSLINLLWIHHQLENGTRFRSKVVKFLWGWVWDKNQRHTSVTNSDPLTDQHKVIGQLF